MELGARLKAIRSKRGMTLAELSTAAGVSKSMLSRVERSEAAPTITTLQKIADALGVTLGRLVDGGERDDTGAPDGGLWREDGRAASSPGQPYRTDDEVAAVSIVRADQRKKLILPWGATYDVLTPDLQRRIEFILISYPVNGGSGDLYAHEGEECGFVLEGRFKGVIGDEEVTLEVGDSIYYASSIPHRWENAGDVAARAVWAVTPPSFLKGRLAD